MNKAEAMFRAFFEDDAEYVLFYLAHRVRIETLTSADAAGPEHRDELRVFNDDGELAVFDDKPSFIRVYGSVAVIAYARKTEERPGTMCPAGTGYECHRDVTKGPALIARFYDGTVVEQYWERGARRLKQDVPPSPAVRGDRIGSRRRRTAAVQR